MKYTIVIVLFLFLSIAFYICTKKNSLLKIEEVQIGVINKLEFTREDDFLLGFQLYDRYPLRNHFSYLAKLCNFVENNKNKNNDRVFYSFYCMALLYYFSEKPNLFNKDLVFNSLKNLKSLEPENCHANFILAYYYILVGENELFLNEINEIEFNKKFDSDVRSMEVRSYQLYGNLLDTESKIFQNNLLGIISCNLRAPLYIKIFKQIEKNKFAESEIGKIKLSVLTQHTLNDYCDLSLGVFVYKYLQPHEKQEEVRISLERNLKILGEKISYNSIFYNIWLEKGEISAFNSLVR